MPINISQSRVAFYFIAVLVLGLVLIPAQGLQSQTSTETTNASQTDKKIIKQIVRNAFLKTADGYSSDEVLLRDDLNAEFIRACRKQDSNTTIAEFNWLLLNLRKSGQLSGIETTRRGKSVPQSVLHIAEIAARQTQDTHRTSIDRIMVRPNLRADFERTARVLDDKVDLYFVRKAAFQLRKTRKLRPELITRIADWGRVISEHSVADVGADFNLIPKQPGIYIFRDKTGYLYIGQSVDLRERLKSHLDKSSSAGLARYLAEQGAENISLEIHAFPKNSRAKKTMIRRAYESELIRNRKPRFNIQP